MSEIYYLGDSLAAWNPNMKYQKFATPGHTTFDMLWDLKHHPEVQGETCILALGVNDIVYHYSLEESFTNYQKLLSLLETRFSNLILVSLLPTDSLKENIEIQKYNSFLANLKLDFLDIYALFLDESGEKIALEYTTDGTHLTRLGYEKLNKALDAFLETYPKEKEAF